MVTSPQHKRRVYVLCRPNFSGDNALVRRPKKIKELLHKSKKSVRPLLQEIGEAKLLEIVKSLLEGRVFETELRAKVEFPELFRPAADRDAQRQASEAEAVRSAEEILDEIASRADEGMNVGDLESSARTEGVKIEESAAEDESDPATKLPVGKRPTQQRLPSLYPSYLPYQTQHLIVNTAQQILEESCFDFATTSMPSILQDNQWDCSVAVELTQWTKLFRTKLGSQMLEASDAEMVQEMLREVSNLRHTAVHRLPMTAKKISQLLASAVQFAGTLRDNLRAAQLEELQHSLDSKIKAMEMNKNVLEDAAASKLQEIQRKREELDDMEATVVQDMLRNDRNNKALIGQLLEDSTRETFGLLVMARQEDEIDGGLKGKGIENNRIEDEQGEAEGVEGKQTGDEESEET